MSPRQADPAIRRTLIETAAHITAAEGPARLTLRRLADEVGTSTMAVYTHFGSMGELRRAVRREGFARLGAHLAAVEITDDPVADYLVLGWAYYVNATTDPDLYRAMFMDGPVDEEDASAGLDTFAICVDAVGRCIEAGRFHAADPTDLATQLWAALHGTVSLEIAHLLPAEQSRNALRAATLNMFTALGDDPDRLSESTASAQRRISAMRTPTPPTSGQITSES